MASTELITLKLKVGLSWKVYTENQFLYGENEEDFYFQKLTVALYCIFDGVCLL